MCVGERERVCVGERDFVCLFDLIFLRPLNNLSVTWDGSSWVEPVLS